MSQLSYQFSYRQQYHISMLNVWRHLLYILNSQPINPYRVPVIPISHKNRQKNQRSTIRERCPDEKRHRLKTIRGGVCRRPRRLVRRRHPSRAAPASSLSATVLAAQSRRSNRRGVTFEGASLLLLLLLLLLLSVTLSLRSREMWVSEGAHCLVSGGFALGGGYAATDMNL